MRYRVANKAPPSAANTASNHVATAISLGRVMTTWAILYRILFIKYSQLTSGTLTNIVPIKVNCPAMNPQTMNPTCNQVFNKSWVYRQLLVGQLCHGMYQFGRFSMVTACLP
mmetsp:Transcript_38737/g.72665  ORF Transcript_38737/g.72665 Transcript_38737/m.72665 type:complete len:112 (-) Transcript_38737:1623-1958(-)